MNKKIILIIAIVRRSRRGVFCPAAYHQHNGRDDYRLQNNQIGGCGSGYRQSYRARYVTREFVPDALSEAPTQEFYDYYISKTPLRLRVGAGDLLLFRHFDASVDPGVLPAIPAGKKAISIPVNAASSVSYFIRPGDLVDVMATYAEQNIDGERW